MERKNIHTIQSVTGKPLGYVQSVKFDTVESEVFSFHHIELEIEGDFYNSWSDAYDAFLEAHNSYYH